MLVRVVYLLFIVKEQANLRYNRPLSVCIGLFIVHVNTLFDVTIRKLFDPWNHLLWNSATFLQISKTKYPVQCKQWM